MAGGGSKPGERRGGRKPGSMNKRKAELLPLRNEIIRAALTGGESPLDVIIAVMRGSEDITERQFAAACAAAPYVHSRLVAATIERRNPFLDMSPDQFTALAAAAERYVAAHVLSVGADGSSEAESGAVH